MSRGINKVILIGNLGADPESRSMANGGLVCNLRLAVSDSWKDKQGNKQERTEWVSVVCFARLGEIAAQYLNKGRQVYVEGRLQTRKWQDKEGHDRYTTEVVASELQMLGDKRAEPMGDGYGKAKGRTDSQRSVDAQRPAGGGGQTGEDDFSDAIPFIVTETWKRRP